LKGKIYNNGDACFTGMVTINVVMTMGVIINLFSYWTRAYYGRNFNLLTQVKGKYDSENIFRFPQSIPHATECD